MSQWTSHGLPERMDGLSFVDVGCWEGDICAEAVARGAASVLGIDYCTSPDLERTLSTSSFDFIQLDLLSEKALQLPEFDVVHSAGVLYHVENPFSFLYRLRKLCRFGGSIHVETTVAIGPTQEPVMLFHPRDSFDANPSNWWSPNEPCLIAMLEEVGLSDIEVTSKPECPSETKDFTMNRICVRGRVANTPTSISQKMLPRRPSYMPIAAGRGSRRPGGQP